MTFITLNRPDVISSTYADGNKYVDMHVKQNPVTINPKKIISMIEYYDSDGKFTHTCVSMEGSLYYNVVNRVEDITKMINSEDGEYVND